MKIVMITGSPHKKGTSALLASEFTKGAISIGHQIVRFDAAFERINPCLACDMCQENKGICIWDDTASKIGEAILESDLVVIVTPLYYFGMSAQIKSVFDRFYAINDKLLSSPKKSILLATGGDDFDWAMDALEVHYKSICRYLNWEIIDILLAKGVYQRGDIEKTDYPQRAREIGKSLVQF